MSSIHPDARAANCRALPVSSILTPEPITQEAHNSLQLVHRNVLSSYEVCDRRFMLQWLLGVSPAYRSAHLQSMVYGNLWGIARRSRRWPVRDMPAVGVMYTNGQRRSAEASAVVKPEGPSASDEIVYTVRGNRTRSDRLSRGYQRAIGMITTSPELIASDAFLPLKHEEITSKVCEYCPVRNVCAVAQYDDED